MVKVYIVKFLKISLFVSFWTVSLVVVTVVGDGDDGDGGVWCCCC